MRWELELKCKSENSCLITYGCAAHWGKLLREDIAPSTVIKHLVKVHKHFQNHAAPLRMAERM